MELAVEVRNPGWVVFNDRGWHDLNRMRVMWSCGIRSNKYLATGTASQRTLISDSCSPLPRILQPPPPVR